MRIPIVIPRDLHFSAHTGVLSLPKRFSHPGSRYCQRDIRREKTKSVSQLPTTKYLTLQLDVLWCSAAPPVTFASGRSLYFWDSIHPMYSASLSIVLTCLLFTPLGPDHPWCASGNALTYHCACVPTWWNTVLCHLLSESIRVVSQGESESAVCVIYSKKHRKSQSPTRDT